MCFLMKKLLILITPTAFVLLAIALYLAFSGEPALTPAASPQTKSAAEQEQTSTERKTTTAAQKVKKTAAPIDQTQSAAAHQQEEVPTAAEQDEQAAQQAVDAFDSLVDSWQEPNPNGVSLKDAENFRAAFSRLPANQKMDGLHRALNLIPDENALLLASLLLDKTQDREVLDTIFSDVLNREDGVKMTILKSIHKDKTHPCWADTAWILDVTGEIPVK